MQMLTRENGEIVITGDEVLLQKIEGESLDGVDISGFQLSADNLADLFNLAQTTYRNERSENGVDKFTDDIKRYAALKAAYLAKFSK
jgi:hypothetical protein